MLEMSGPTCFRNPIESFERFFGFRLVRFGFSSVRVKVEFWSKSGSSQSLVRVKVGFRSKSGSGQNRARFRVVSGSPFNDGINLHI